MTADVLREAARLMRERAEALEGRRWSWTGAGDDYPQYVTQITSQGNAALVAETFGGPDHPAWEAEHIASWDPVVALAVADLLDGLASDEPWDFRHDEALTVARAYLGGAS